jgi:hypothetical protein
MKPKFYLVLTAALLIGSLPACAEKGVDEEIDDVLEEQQEAANRAVRTPGDTAKIREEAEDVLEEQKDVQDAVRREAAEKDVPATTTQK